MNALPAIPFEPLGGRLDRLPGRFASAIVGLKPSEIDQAIHDLLEQIGEALEVDHVSFESFSDNVTGCGSVCVWTRRGATATRESALTVPVTVAGRCISTLSVGFRKGVLSWPPAIVDRLRLLADLTVLAVQRGRPVREPEQVRSEAAGSEASAETSGFDEGWDPKGFEDIIGDCPALRVAIGRVHEVAPTDASVILLGETGTGKELFARAVHNLSARRGRPFVRVNCAALPSTLIESELFGHERGAFTGAVSTRQGRFEVAHRGTLFLDEIGDLPADVQAKLLRVLQEGEYERVGSSQSRKVDVRLVAATHHDLEAAVREKRFRADLYYRLNVFPIALPPLRERIEDIPRLVWYFISRRQRALNRKFTCIPDAVFAALAQHSWPGNVRELENVVERAMIHSTGDTLRLDEGVGPHIPDAVRETGTLEEVERRHIENTLRRCQWRINGPGNTAEVLGLHPNTLRFRMKKLGIRRATGAVIRKVGRISA
jgi:formate hydrogenlyase transcriptional activator